MKKCSDFVQLSNYLKKNYKYKHFLLTPKTCQKVIKDLTFKRGMKTNNSPGGAI